MDKDMVVYLYNAILLNNYNMNEYQHKFKNVEWMKPDINYYILCVSIYMWFQKGQN